MPSDTTSLSVAAQPSSRPAPRAADVAAVRRPRQISDFDSSLIPSNAIYRRKYHAFSVHFSVATSKWIVTLARQGNAEIHPTATQDDRRRCVSFSFSGEREARKFARAYTPPKMMTGAVKCLICSTKFSSRCLSYNCRNCGVCICDQCSTRWGIRMIPRTYLTGNKAALTTRVCKSCDWLSNAFCMALLQGKYDDAVMFHETGNINLRCCFADIHQEAMFPIHCAVMGGSLRLVRWLVETQGCPISVKRDPKTAVQLSVQTSSNRTLVDLAMTGKPKIEILSYLVQHGLSVTDTKDPSLAPKTLQTMMKAGFVYHVKDRSHELEPTQMADSSEASAATLEDVCIICCERQMDSVLTPCGHQMCCSDCGGNLTKCPICKAECKMLRIFRL